MDTNKNWTKSCTIIIMYYNSHYLSIFLIILFHQSGVIWSFFRTICRFTFLRSKDQSIGSESNDIDIKISRIEKSKSF